MNEPFLFQFKQSCSTEHEIGGEFFYDDKTDMVVMEKNGNLIPSIHCSGKHVPGTKKADVETGEDAKDSIM